MSEKVEYEVLEDGPVLGDYYKKGKAIWLFPRQAKYLTAPYGDRLRRKGGLKPAAKPTDKPSAKPSENPAKSEGR